MINTQGAVVLGMVYNYLPFMILPIYSVIVKLDGSLVEAARDLGADGVRVFRKVIFPLSLPGILSGVTMVFVPSVSTFAISKLLGGNNELLLGEAYPLRSSNNQLTSFIYLFDDDLTAAPYQTPPEGFDPEAYYIAYTWQPDLWTRLDMASTKYGENQYFSNYKYILGCNAILDYNRTGRG